MVRPEVVDDHGGGRSALPATNGTLKVTGSTEAMRCRQHGKTTQVASRLRPLRRRPAKMARPARVRIRRRNPCVLLRLRLFGWNVRLLTRATPGLDSRSRDFLATKSTKREIDTDWTSGICRLGRLSHGTRWPSSRSNSPTPCPHRAPTAPRHADRGLTVQEILRSPVENLLNSLALCC